MTADNSGRRPVPWQVWTVVVLLGLEGIGNLFAIPKQPVAAVWLVVKCVIIIGLLKAWPGVFVAFIVLAGIHVLHFAAGAPVIALMNLLLIGLLIWARRFFFRPATPDGPVQPEREAAVEAAGDMAGGGAASPE